MGGGDDGMRFLEGFIKEGLGAGGGLGLWESFEGVDVGCFVSGTRWVGFWFAVGMGMDSVAVVVGGREGIRGGG